MQKQIYLVFIILNYRTTIEIVKASKGSPQRVRFTDGSVKFNNEIFSSLNSSVDSNGSLSVYFETTKTLNPGLRLAVTMQYKLSDSNKYQTMLTYDMDTCKLLIDSHENFMMQIWFRDALKFGRLPSKCPINAGIYEVHNYNVDKQNIPAYLPSGDYRVHELFYYGKPKTNRNRTFVALLKQNVRFA